jgi:hypothetical protein
LWDRVIGRDEFVKALQSLAETLRSELRGPLREPPKFRANMERLRNDARRFKTSLDRATQGLALLYWSMTGPKWPGQAHKAAERIVKLADETLARTPAVKKKGRPKQPGRITTALMVIEAWLAAYGQAPGHGNAEAWAYCEEVWRACGGKPGCKRSLWKRHLQAALKTSGPMRDRIQAKFTSKLP